jgi:hypothetical protein
VCCKYDFYSNVIEEDVCCQSLLSVCSLFSVSSLVDAFHLGDIVVDAFSPHPHYVKLERLSSSRNQGSDEMWH